MTKFGAKWKRGIAMLLSMIMLFAVLPSVALADAEPEEEPSAVTEPVTEPSVATEPVEEAEPAAEPDAETSEPVEEPEPSAEPVEAMPAPVEETPAPTEEPAQEVQPTAEPDAEASAPAEEAEPTVAPNVPAETTEVEASPIPETDGTAEETLPEADAELTIGEAIEGMLLLKDDIYRIRLTANAVCDYRMTVTGAASVVLKDEQTGEEKEFAASQAEDGSWIAIDEALQATVGTSYIVITALEDQTAFAWSTEEILPVQSVEMPEETAAAQSVEAVPQATDAQSTDAAQYVFETETVYLQNVLSALNITLTENNYTVSVDNSAVQLSGRTIRMNNLSSFTLTANDYFDLATLTLRSRNGKDTHSITLSYPAPEAPDPIEYTFTDVDDSVMLRNLLSANGVSTAAIESVEVTEGDAEAIEILEQIGDYTIIPIDRFDAIVLTVTTQEGETVGITLHFPEKTVNLVDYIPEDAIWANDDLYLTGKMPGNAIVEATPVDVVIDGKTAFKAYDIKIYANANQQAKGKTWQPAGKKVQVHYLAERVTGDVDVYHLATAEAEAQFVATVPVENGWVAFDAESFSVYAVIDHEGETTVVTPRVQFHFIGQEFTGTANPYSASPYNFINKADPASYQTSQILTADEGNNTLEMIANPPNIVTYALTQDTEISGDKTYYIYEPATNTYAPVASPVAANLGSYYEIDSEKIFYGWYVVEMLSDNTSYNTNDDGKWAGTIRYNWPEEPDKITFESPMTLTDASGNELTDETELSVGMTLKWTIDGVTYAGELDEEGIIHVYLAPIYEDYYFINFRMGALDAGSSGEALKNSLLTRRLVVFGSADSVSVRIGDIICPSSDPTHLVFIGWQTAAMAEEADVADQYYPTVDDKGKETNSTGSNSGYYISVSKSDFGERTTYDLYPLFAEARWLNFNTGLSGNGATYIGSTYRLTNDQGVGSSYDNAFFNENTSTRNGYNHEGWYVFAAQNAGEITNLTTAQDVVVTYYDAEYAAEHEGKHPTVTFNMKAIKLVQNVNGTYSLVAPANNANIATTTVDGTTYTLSASGGVFYLKIGSAPAEKLFGVENGELYFYRLMNDLTVYANWTMISQTTYKVVIWKQKVTDDKDAADADKTYDYEIFFVSDSVSSSNTLSASSFSGSYTYDNNGAQATGTLNNRNLTSQTVMNGLAGLSGHFTGFHYARNDMDGKTPKSDGTSVYNVYYDRDLRTINFYYNDVNNNNVTAPDDAVSAYQFTVTTSNSGTQYGVVNDQYVELRYENGVWKAPVYENTPYVDPNGAYGLTEDGEYVELEPEYGDVTVYRLTSTLSAGNNYLIVSSNGAGTAYALRRNGTSVATDAVTVVSGSPNYINSADVEDTSVWTVASGYTFKNGNYYLRNNNNSLQISTTSSNWSWNSNNNRLYSGNRYLRYYSGTFSLANTNNSVYLYQKTTTTAITGYKCNGETYTGDRYSFRIQATGEYTEYTATRFTRSSFNNSGNYHMVTWSGLYGQSLAQNGYSWDDVSAYYWREGTNPESGTGQTFLDSFIQDSNPYDLVTNTSSGSFTLYHYRQQLDGTYTIADREEAHLTLGTGTTTFNLTNKFNGFTVSSYNVGTNGFSSTGGSSTGSSVSIRSSDGALHVYHTRDTEEFTFNVNYPEGATITYDGKTVAEGGVRSENRTESVLYEAPLSGYGYTKSTVNNVEITRWYYGVDDDTNDATNVLIAPDHYIFGGWYEDATCTVPFNFNSTMPAANKIVYAKWTPETFLVKIDPNGGEIDHVDHRNNAYAAWNLTAFFRTPGTYDNTKSTYFDAEYGETVSEYAVERNYVPMSSASAAQYAGQKYYYLNTQWLETDGVAGLYPHLRNALYIVADPEKDDAAHPVGRNAAPMAAEDIAELSELHQYYELYRQIVKLNLDHYASANDGLVLLDYDTWKATYLTHQTAGALNSPFQLYRATNSQEHYEFLGWYEVLDAGTSSEHLAEMPYVFSTPIDSELTLRAVWRLDGGYRIQYHADYTMDDGTLINGDMAAWVDPTVGDAVLSYADGAITTVFKQPNNIRTPQGPTDEYIFHGFRLVSVKVDANGHVNYMPYSGMPYYYPGDAFPISASFADENSIIHLQAVYQEKDAAYRRPDVTNLTLDANGGHLVTSSGARMTENTNLTAESGWEGIGTVAATVIDPETNIALDPDEIIEFGDIQSNETIHLYRYATNLTHVGGIAENAELDPAGTNYFAHDQNFFLLGFDEGKMEGDFIATYAADAVIAIDRAQNQTIYAVWEPRIYLNFVNNTDSTVHFGLSSTHSLTLYILNEVTGLYDREKITDPSNMSIEPGKTMHLALPYGQEQTLTVSGRNELGVGKILTWDTSITDDATGVTYTSMTGVNTDEILYNQASYTHLNGDDSCEHALAHGRVSSTSGSNTFSFDEKLLFNTKGVTVTFDDDQIGYALVLDDNYEGGGMQEYDYESVSSTDSQLLPSTSTRMGYQLLGWAYTSDATTPVYSTAAGWTITDLVAFFTNASVETTMINDGFTKQAKLYAVWTINNASSTVYIYKNVPEPGNQNLPFEFTLSLYGKYTRQSKTTENSASNTFELYHGDYAILRSSNKTDQGTMWTDIAIYKANGEDRVTNFRRTSDSTIDPSKIYYTFDSGTNMYTPVDAPTAANLSSYYEAIHRVMVTASNADSGGSWNDVRITVTETPVQYYNTSVTRSAQTAGDYLYLGTSSDVATANLEVETNEAYWTTTFAGGTLVFTNQRQTYDVTLEKILHSNTSVPGTFPFTASYLVDGRTVTLESSQVTSGTPNTTWLADIPAGALLTIREANNGSYTAKYKIDDGAWQNAVDVLTDGVRTGSSTQQLTVDGDMTVTFDNTLKSFPVRFRLFDQLHQPLSGMFSLTSSIGVFGGLYADTEKGGVFYPRDYPTSQYATLFVDSYQLEENIIPTGYIGLTTPATIEVTGDGITTDSDMIYIEEDPEMPGAYIITVYNIVPSVDITLTKKLDDPILQQRTFTFTVGYVYELKDGLGNVMKTIRKSETYEIQATRAGASEVISVPGGATVTVTENLTAALRAIYDVQYQVEEQTPVPESTYSDVVDDDMTVVFTNTRKMATVTVVKEVNGTYNGSFAFTATVNADYDSNGFTDGVRSFDVSVGHPVELLVPVGQSLTVTEATGDGYVINSITAATAVTNTGSADNVFKFDVWADNTITFNNYVLPAPTSYSMRTAPYVWALAVGACLAIGVIVPLVSKRRRKEEEDA